MHPIGSQVQADARIRPGWIFRKIGNSRGAIAARRATNVTMLRSGSKTRNADSAETRFALRTRAHRLRRPSRNQQQLNRSVEPHL